MDGLERYDRRHGWRGAWGHVATLTGWEAVAKKTVTPAERRTWRAAVVTDIKGGVRVTTVEGQTGALAAEDVAWARSGRGIGAGDLIFVAPDDKGGGRFPAQTGSGGERRTGGHGSGTPAGCWPWSGATPSRSPAFNRATQALRQPGSAFKPIVYATALESGYTPASVVMDAPITLPGGNGKAWTPENYEHEYLGPLQLAQRPGALAQHHDRAPGPGRGHAQDQRLGHPPGRRDQDGECARHGAGRRRDDGLSPDERLRRLCHGGRKIEPHLIELVAGP